MAEYEKIWEESIPAEHGGVMYSASIRVRLHGKWSGNKTTGTPQAQTDRRFKLKITGDYLRATVPTQSGEMWTSDEWYCAQNDPNSDGEIIYAICVDELYCKWVGSSTDGNLVLPFVRRARERATDSEDAEYYVACEEITETGSYPGTATDLILQYIAMAQNADMCLTNTRLNPTAGLQWCYNLNYDIETDLPIFATESDLMDYINSNGTDTSKIINVDGSPEEDYNESTRFWFIKNRIGHNTRVGSDYTAFRNYRFYPLSKKKICLFQTSPSAESPYTLKMKSYTGYDVRRANTPYASDDDDYESYLGAVETNYLSSSIQFDTDNYYTCFQFMTNIPIFASETSADDYINGITDITSAVNWQDIARIYDEVIRPPYGEEDAGNDNGTNGQSYVQGVRMYVLSSMQLNTFFSDIFDETKITDILQGLQLFGTNQITAIQSLMYLPLDADDIATVYATPQNIKVGSYSCPNAVGRYVMNNNKMIDCGGFNCVRVYGDFRDYEIQMVLQLPYIGFRDIKIADLLEKYVSFKYSVDITSGACSCHVYADGIEIACYDGNMGSQRPIQSIDQQTYLSNILGAVTGVVSPLPDSISGKAGAVTQAMAGDVGGAVSTGVSNLSSVALAKTALNAYGLEQTVKDVPINTRGSFAGCLGYFAWQKIHIHTYISKSYKPAGALQNIGAPSGVGQAVGMFSGFLSVSFFQIADGFTGTESELAEIYDVLRQGIYL